MNYGRKATRKKEKNLTSTKIKMNKKMGVIIRRLFIIVIILLIVLGITTVVEMWKSIVESAPDISAIDVTPTGYSTTVQSSDGQEIATLVASGANRKYVTINEIPKNLQNAFVAIEDSRFYEHNGIDLKGIARALVADIASGSTNQGASTLTQQLIKNSVLEEVWNSEESTVEKIERKVQEQYLAVELEKQVSKEWILENYLNTINLGANTLGVQAASERYFGKDVSELTLSECAVIAGITKNPSAYNPIKYPDENAKRRSSVLKAMRDQGYISDSEYETALKDDVYSRIAEYNLETENSYNTYFVDATIEDVKDDLMEDLGYTETEAYKALYQGGLTIVSTQDLSIQDICDEEVNNLNNYPLAERYSAQFSFQVKESDGTYKTYTNTTMAAYYKQVNHNEDYEINYNSEEDCRAAIAEYESDMLASGGELVENSETINITIQPEVAMTIMDQYTGEVKALVGGRGDKNGNRTWNRATDTLRQPGSTFKIIAAYAPAIDAGGLTLASVQDDAPLTIGEKTYNNYDKKYRGYTSFRTAIIHSINIVTVKTLQQIGVNLGFEYAQKFGFSTLVEDDKNYGLCLGGLTNGVSNLELTGAYAAIANSGTYLEPKFYTKVYDHNGNILLDKSMTQNTHEVLSEQTAWLLTSAMKDVMTQGTGSRAYFGESMAQAGKSGTTTSNRDALFAGYTPYYTCVVWGGYDDNSKQNGNYTAYPKNIWKAVMSRIHENLEYKDFVQPSGITTATICAKSGLKPIEGVCDSDPRGSMLRTEYFAADNVPGEVCDHHTTVKICSASGKLATEYCPLEDIISKVAITGCDPSSPEAEYSDSSSSKKKCKVHTAGTVTDDGSVTDDAGDGTLDTNGDGSTDGGTDDGSTDGGITDGGSDGSSDDGIGANGIVGY